MNTSENEYVEDYRARGCISKSAELVEYERQLISQIRENDACYYTGKIIYNMGKIILIFDSSSAGFNVRYIYKGITHFITSTEDFDIDKLFDKVILKIRDSGFGVESAILLQNDKIMKNQLSLSIRDFVQGGE